MLAERIVRFCNNEPLSEPEMFSLVEAKYVTYNGSEPYLTDEGINFAEAQGVIMRLMSILTLASPITVYGEDQTSVNLLPGSQLMVLFARKHKKYGKYFECFLGEGFPVVNVYGSNHEVKLERYPINRKLEPTLFGA